MALWWNGLNFEIGLELNGFNSKWVKRWGFWLALLWNGLNFEIGLEWNGFNSKWVKRWAKAGVGWI